MDGTMQGVDLLVSGLFLHGVRTHPDSEVLHYQGEVVQRYTYREFACTVTRLAGGLSALGVGCDDVVATLCWNSPAHLAAYFAVPGMGAVLHTLNLRLHDDQLVYVANHASDKVILVDADLVPQLQRIIGLLDTVEIVIVAGDADLDAPAHIQVHRLDALLAAQDVEFAWPPLDERSAAALCYTTGTTGAPKGVAYTHRSMYLHSLIVATGSALGLSDADRLLPIVPMFHANAWGWPHAAWMSGSDIVLNDRFLQPEHLARIIADLKPTAAAAVPTVWTGLDRYARHHRVDLSSLRVGVAGGSPLTTILAHRMLSHHGVHMVEGWGMTETSPLLTLSRPPARAPADDFVSFAGRTGHIIPGVEVRVVDDQGAELPWDGVAVGELQLRGPTIAGSYFRDGVPEKFDGGWLRTGDLGVIHHGGWVQLKDRLKDGIKSGGEWISTIELEQALVAHPAVTDVAVIGVADPKWEERPLACVVLTADAAATAGELRTFLEEKVAGWCLPEYWTFVAALPTTSVGKIDKKELRRRHADEELHVEVLRRASASLLSTATRVGGPKSRRNR